MRLEFQPTASQPATPDEDREILDREFNEVEFRHLRGLFVATQTIRTAERMMASGIPSTIYRHEDDGTTLELDVTSNNIQVWKRLAFGLCGTLQKDGLKDVVQAVIRRAHRTPIRLVDPPQA